MASITLTNVWKVYNKKVLAVKDLNMVCNDGEFLALLGPSGCGKTSTLRMVAGLEEISSGVIRIGETVVNGLRPRERDIAMVFETYGLYPHLSVYDNIAFPLRVRRLSDEEIRRRVNKAASVVDMEGILKEFPGALGDGQKQRVSIARAIVREPAVFLFDEPISHLDETLRRRMRAEIKHLQATLGTTMVYVTHDQIEAMAMADRIVVMDLGEVQQIGSPGDLYNRPANLFVAGFIGEPPMNILNGQLEQEDGVLSFCANGFRLPIVNPKQAKYCGRAVPQRSSWASGRRTSTPNAQPATSPSPPSCTGWSRTASTTSYRSKSATRSFLCCPGRGSSRSRATASPWNSPTISTSSMPGQGKASSMLKEQKMAEVKLEGVTKRYLDKEAISGMTWAADQGEFVVLFGPSGAGKTTTLKVIAGLEPLEEGEVYFNGQPMKEVDTADRDVAMAFENYALYPHMSVFDNIAFPMMIPGRGKDFSRDDIKRRVAEIATVLQIEMLLDRKPQALSGGQRQRVALGRCLVREPQVCLLDEPIAHLDAKLRHRMYAELKRIQRERGTTTIYATPAQSEAMAMADKIVIIFEGKVQQIASPRELYQCPATVEIARFGGEQPMNILPITLEQDGGGLSFALGENHVAASANLEQIVKAHKPGRDVLLGVRPSDIVLASHNGEAGAIQASLYALEHLGRSARMTAQIGEQLVEVTTYDEVRSRIGDTVYLSIANSPLYIFDTESHQLVGAAGTDGEAQ